MKKYEIEIKEGAVVFNEEALSLLEQAQVIEVQQKKVEKQMKAFKEAIKNAMREAGVDKAEINLPNGNIAKITYVSPTTRLGVDTNALKQCPNIDIDELEQDGLLEAYKLNGTMYERFSKTSDVADSIRMTFAEGEEE